MDIKLMARRYIQYCAWCQRSGYAPLDWPEYKALRKHYYVR